MSKSAIDQSRSTSPLTPEASRWHPLLHSAVSLARTSAIGTSAVVSTLSDLQCIVPSRLLVLPTKQLGRMKIALSDPGIHILAQLRCESIACSRQWCVLQLACQIDQSPPHVAIRRSPRSGPHRSRSVSHQSCPKHWRP
jgi:hypothetical protein